jgi:hypothetical protein
MIIELTSAVCVSGPMWPAPWISARRALGRSIDSVGNKARGSGCIAAADDQDGKTQASVRTWLGPFPDQGREIERSFRYPACQVALQLRTQGAPRTTSAPIVDEGFRRAAVVSRHHAAGDCAGDRYDFGKRLGDNIDILEEVEGRRLIKYQVCDAVRRVRGNMLVARRRRR